MLHKKLRSGNQTTELNFLISFLMCETKLLPLRSILALKHSSVII